MTWHLVKQNPTILNEQTTNINKQKYKHYTKQINKFSKPKNLDEFGNPFICGDFINPTPFVVKLNVSSNEILPPFGGIIQPCEAVAMDPSYSNLYAAGGEKRNKKREREIE